MDTIIIHSAVTVAWLAFSFLFWRTLRSFATSEDRIFDLTFYATLAAFVASRMGFVLTHGEQFLGKSPFLMAALWVAPGLSWLAGLVGGVATLVVLSRRYKVRLGLVLDAIAASLPLAITISAFGSFFALRHSVQLYEMIAVVILSVVTLRLTVVSVKHKWPYGLVGVWFFLLYAAMEFGLEFFKAVRVYWGGLSANQWILIGIFAQCIGVLYVRGGGREKFLPIVRKLYESISRRNTH